MNKVYVMGGAQTDFERNWSREGKNVVAMLREVMSDGCANADLTYDDIISSTKKTAYPALSAASFPSCTTTRAMWVR